MTAPDRPVHHKLNEPKAGSVDGMRWLEDTCPCGGKLHVEGTWPEIDRALTRWLNAHWFCKVAHPHRRRWFW